MWTSSKMGDLIMRRLAKAKFPYEFRHVAYNNARTARQTAVTTLLSVAIGWRAKLCADA
jgi:hypothetical protein